jgi:hypothetical protein
VSDDLQPLRLGRRCILAICGGVLVAACAQMTWLSQWFALDTEPSRRPLIEFFALISAMFVVHWIAFRCAIGMGRSDQRYATLIIGATAVLARLVLLPSHPIQEVDLYRYLWDGQATISGVSPYRHAPAEVIDVIDQAGGEAADATAPDASLAVLAQRAAAHRTVGTMVRRVHYGHLPTVYPTVSQVVFAAVAVVVPTDAPLRIHVIAMKIAIVAFDLAVVAVLFWLLRCVRLPFAWVITYAWNPLVLKEFSNSGHLDSIAVFFTTLAVAFVVKAVIGRSTWHAVAAAVSLGLGFGAKLYPVLLLPLLLVTCYRILGLPAMSVAGSCFAVTALATVIPVWMTGQSSLPHGEGWEVQPRVPIVSELEPPIPGDDGINESPADVITREADSVQQAVRAVRPTEGIEAFLTKWEMNDLLFLLVHENVRPGDHKVWFVVAPETVRSRVSGGVAKRIGTMPDVAAFLVARALTLAVFCIFAGLFTLRIDAGDPLSFCRAAFLVLAFFWLLSPTLNPWYWTWALPLIAFAKSRGWILVSGLLPVYYLRFWFACHANDPIMRSAPYPRAIAFEVPWNNCCVVVGSVK